MSIFEGLDRINARSWLLGEGIDLSRIHAEPLARSPLTIRVGSGIAVVYRYGAVVLFEVEPVERRAFFAELVDADSMPEGEGDSAELRLAGSAQSEGVDANGAIALASFDVFRLRVVAEALARSAVLSFYEAHLAGVLARLEDPILRLREAGRLPFKTRGLLRSVGDVLDTEMRMVGRAEVSEKPEFVWDEPRLDRLYTHLAEEYELADRDRALSRKIDLVMRTVSVLVDALSVRRTLHVEWAIFALILAELFILL